MASVDFFSKYLLEKLGDKFWVVTLIPSISLVLTCVFVFDPLLNISSAIAVQSTFGERLSILLGIILVPAVIIAFTLYTVQTYILQLYEGHGFHRLPFLRNSQIRKANRLLEKINDLKKQITKLETKEIKKDALANKVSDLKGQYYQLAAEYDQSFPYSADLILPTRLGNILRASETYPAARYGMDAVSWWPRLYNLIPKETKQGIEGALNELYILLNFSVFSMIFSVLCLIAILYNSVIPLAMKNPEFTLRYVYAGVVALICSLFFYRMSLFKAGAFGNQIRSAYDLYRLQLLEQMKIKPPENSVDEYFIWKNLGEFIVLRDFSLEFTHFDYIWTQQDSKKSDSVPDVE